MSSFKASTYPSSNPILLLRPSNPSLLLGFRLPSLRYMNSLPLLSRPTSTELFGLCKTPKFSSLSRPVRFCSSNKSSSGVSWLPEKRVLERILDILQKKDIHEKFAEPVKPEEVIRSITPMVDEILKPKLLDLLPCIFECVCHHHVAVRLAASRCIASMAKSMTACVMGAVIEKVIPMLWDSESVHSMTACIDFAIRIQSLFLDSHYSYNIHLLKKKIAIAKKCWANLHVGNREIRELIQELNQQARAVKLTFDDAEVRC